MDMMNDLYEMCETLARALKEANEKIRGAGGKLTAGDMDYVNKLAHALKSIVTVKAMKEAEEMDEGGSYDGGSYRRDYSRDGGPYRDGGSYDGGSYTRGRSRNARRDNMGRYSNRGYSRDDREGGYSGHGNMVDELRELMNIAPDEQTRQEFQRLIDKMQR